MIKQLHGYYKPVLPYPPPKEIVEKNRSKSWHRRRNKRKKRLKPLLKRTRFTQMQYHRFRLALKMNNMSISKWSKRLNHSPHTIRTYMMKINRKHMPEKIYNEIMEYTDKVYEYIHQGIIPKNIVIIDQPSIDSPRHIEYMGQDEIEQIIATSIPSLYEYIKSTNSIYLAVQSSRKKSRIWKIRDWFIGLEYSVVKKVVYMESRNRKWGIVVLVADDYNEDELLQEYKDCLENVISLREGYAKVKET